MSVANLKWVESQCRVRRCAYGTRRALDKAKERSHKVRGAQDAPARAQPRLSRREKAREGEGKREQAREGRASCTEGRWRLLHGKAVEASLACTLEL